jgi:O-acetyl-ADP-ribose deacetylase (regulator of RNase III)
VGNSGLLNLDQYRALVHLDEPFRPSDQGPEAEAGRIAAVERLLTHLRSEGTSVHVKGTPVTYEEKRRQLYALLTMRAPDPLPHWFHAQMDRILQREARERGVTNSESLPRIARLAEGTPYGAADRCALWLGDITTLGVDAIVNAANAELLGCFHPFHACIDNVIHAAAGPRLREDCHIIMSRQGMSEPTGCAKVTRAYNLRSRYILHTVGPIVRHGDLLPEHEEQLAACYRSCLDLASCIHAIRSVAFCCISTGVFGFPQEDAARIALSAVSGWLTGHPGAMSLVVFNVFRQDDFDVYRRLLCAPDK